jgi:uncharacterized membrane protein
LAAETLDEPRKWEPAWVGSIALALIGLVDSIYLSWVKLANQTASCAAIGDCEAVNNSRYAEVAGVPIALIGAAGYLLILILLFVDRPGGPENEAVRFALFGVTLAGTVYSIYLTYIELFVLRAVCPFCVLSAVIMAGLFVLSIIRLRLWA